jgi:hypothetical protein
VGLQRVQHRVRGLPDPGRQARRPARPPPHVQRRGGAVHGRLRVVRDRSEPGAVDLRALPAGHRRSCARAVLARDGARRSRPWRARSRGRRVGRDGRGRRRVRPGDRRRARERVRLATRVPGEPADRPGGSLPRQAQVGREPCSRTARAARPARRADPRGDGLGAVAGRGAGPGVGLGQRRRDRCRRLRARGRDHVPTTMPRTPRAGARRRARTCTWLHRDRRADVRRRGRVLHAGTRQRALSDGRLALFAVDGGPRRHSSRRPARSSPDGSRRSATRAYSSSSAPSC